jgi:glutamate synthase (NADPH) small chain
MSKKLKGSILKPLRSLKFLGEKPVTIRVPYETRPTAPRYRGFHRNDLDTCIGCGTCSEICDNDAIRLVEVPGCEAGTGKTNKKPLIDYGRCCWCALCVDVCTTGSLSMTQEYIHISPETDDFFFLPDEKGIHGEEYPAGYAADEKINFLDLQRIAMEELPAEERKDSFVEIVKGFSKEQAQKEASRCVACGLCTATCPAQMNIPEYIDAIWRDDLEEAGRQIYKNNPLPDVCGRICTHKCEDACSIGNRGEPLSIRWLKRYAMDAVPAEDYEKLLDQKVVEHNGASVGIVGAGPAGLSAAYYLGLMGYEVTIYEAYPEAGGMMRYGIPEYRLPYETLDKDIDFIKKLGVDIRTKTKVGEDVSLEELREKHDAVYIATGFHQGRSTRTPGTDHENVFQAIDLLARITRGEEFRVDENIVVIGGGNVAMDIARSLARKQMAAYGRVGITVTSLESRDIMPADEEEIVESQEEGIVFYPGRGPAEVLVDEKGGITGLKTNKCTRVFDEEGRFSPQFDESDVLVLEGSQVIEAIGQAPDMSYLGEWAEKLELDGRRIKVDEYYRSSEPWLFVGGDIIKGPDVINGIATGHQAALGIDDYLRKLAGEAIAQSEAVDVLLEEAADYEERSMKVLRGAIAAAGGVAGAASGRAGGRDPHAQLRQLQRIAEVKKDFAEKVRRPLTNRNMRIHLSQKIGRDLRNIDLAVLRALPEIEGRKVPGDALLALYIRAGYRFYNDLLALVDQKELEFLFEYLRDEHYAYLKMLKKPPLNQGGSGAERE